jgi:hypothetical protein
MKKQLSIGMATYDDYNGVYFTIQALRLYHPICTTDKVEFIIIDNNPSSKHGEQTKAFSNHVKAKYIPNEERVTTAIRNEIFKNASGKFTICMDPHVLICKTGINKLMDYYKDRSTHKNIVSGPLLYDDMKHISTHFNPVWRDHMYGIWETDQRAYDDPTPFEIPMQGLGCFSCKTDNWQGFNEKFTGFGGEEGYIHEKFRQAGGKAICLPDFKWMHRFGRPDGVPYPLCLEDRIFNYFIGWLEIYKDPEHDMIKTIFNHFKDKLPPNRINIIFENAKNGADSWSGNKKVNGPKNSEDVYRQSIPKNS